MFVLYKANIAFFFILSTFTTTKNTIVICEIGTRTLQMSGILCERVTH